MTIHITLMLFNYIRIPSIFLANSHHPKPSPKFVGSCFTHRTSALLCSNVSWIGAVSVEPSEAKMSTRRRVCVVDRLKLIDGRGTVGKKGDHLWV